MLLDPAEGTAEGLSMEAEVGWGATLVVAGAGKDSGTGCKVGVRILLVTGTRFNALSVEHNENVWQTT